MSAEPITRRGLVAGAVAGACAVTGLAPPPPRAGAAALDDRAILRLSLQVEQVLALAYQLALARDLLDRRTRATVAAIGAQEGEHGTALTTYLREVGGPLPAPPRGVAAVDAVAPGLDRAANRAELLGVLVRLEQVAIYSYYLGVQQLYDQKLVQTATAILGGECQHLVALRTALGQDPLPAALAVGTPVRSAGVR